MCKDLKGCKAPPLMRVKVKGPDGRDTFVTQPELVDEAAIAAWEPIHAGNVSANTEKLLFRNLLASFGEHAVKREPQALTPITGTQVADGIAKAPDSTCGLDGVRKGDLASLSPLGCEWLASMFNCIEAGAQWPQQSLCGRLVFLAKGGNDFNPLDYRKISILSKCYRLHMSIRLRDVCPWVASWAMDCLFAGTNAPSGAEDAWYETALEVELAKLINACLTGGGADIYKCFDQISLILLGLMLTHGGFPPQLWHAYYAFHSNVVYHNSVAGMLGRPHRHPMSIPQGCPFSMTFIAFMLVPWARSMLSVGCIPRALADDILITAKGDQHELLFLRGYTLTLLYFHIIGARIAITKCFLFSTCTATRARLQNHVWPIINCSITVVLHYRDLGAHICLGNRMVAPTLRDRLVAGHGICQKLANTGWEYSSRHRASHTLVLPLSLYGCEASPFPLAEMGKLVTSVARNIGPYSHLSSNTMAFLTASAGNLDPIEEVLYRRVAMLRRMLCKHSKLAELVSTIYDIYEKAGMFGTNACHGDLSQLQPAPPPGGGSHDAWTCSSIKVCGPIGPLLQQLHDFAWA